jgi:hypothetical protein
MKRDRRRRSVGHERVNEGAIAPPVWESDPYPVTDDGRMLVQVVKLQGPEWVRKFQRWSLRIECTGVYESVDLSLFVNLAGDKNKPGLPGRQSNFYRYWTMANGQPPKKGQAMNWDVFLGKYFMAEVGKVRTDASGQEKAEGEIYSRISHFIRLEEM